MSATESPVNDFKPLKPLDEEIEKTFKEASKHRNESDGLLPVRLFILRVLFNKKELIDVCDDGQSNPGGNQIVKAEYSQSRRWELHYLETQKSETKKIVREYYKHLFAPSDLPEHDPIAMLKKMNGKDPILSQAEFLWGETKFLGKNKLVPANHTFVKPNLYCVEEKKDLTSEEFDNYFEVNSDAISKPKYVLMRGGLGSGKTRLLKYLSLKYAEERKGKHIPIYVNLADLRYIDLISSNTATDRFHTLRDYIFHKNENVCKTEFLEKLLEQGKIFILLDGIEIGSDHHDRYVLQQIRDFIKEYKGCTFIITCRSFPLGDLFVDFQKLEIRNWKSEQIKRFVESWIEFNLIRTDEENTNLPPLTKAEDDRIKEHFNGFNSHFGNTHIGNTIDSPITPLILSFLCIEFFDNEKVTNNTNTPEITWLVRETLFYIVACWDNTHANEYSGIYQNLSPKHREDLLGEIALECLKILKIELSISHLSSFVRRVLAPVMAQNESSFSQNDIERLLQEIECQGGLFNRNQKKDDVFYKFSHRKIRDYFAALAISRKSWEQWEEISQEFASTDESTRVLWMEIFKEAKQLLSYRADQINKFIEENKSLNDKK